MNKLTLLLALLITCQAVFADKRYDDFYIVEMIVFTNELRMYREEEYWPDQLELTVKPPLLFLEAIEPATVYPELYGKAATISSTQLPLLTQNKAELSDAANKIRTAGRHRLLSHQLWLQKLDDKSNALPMAVQAGREVNGFYEVSGTITLHKGRYLHIESNLWRSIFTNKVEEALAIQLPFISSQLNNFNEPLLSTDESESNLAEEAVQPLVSIVSTMQQRRRMRSKEVHFLDHPLFGIIIQLRPYQGE